MPCFEFFRLIFSCLYLHKIKRYIGIVSATGLKNLNSSIKHYIDELTRHSTVAEIMERLESRNRSYVEKPAVSGEK